MANYPVPAVCRALGGTSPWVRHFCSSAQLPCEVGPCRGGCLLPALRWLSHDLSLCRSDGTSLLKSVYKRTTVRIGTCPVTPCGSGCGTGHLPTGHRSGDAYVAGLRFWPQSRSARSWFADMRLGVGGSTVGPLSCFSPDLSTSGFRTPSRLSRQREGKATACWVPYPAH